MPGEHIFNLATALKG